MACHTSQEVAHDKFLEVPVLLCAKILLCIGIALLSGKYQHREVFQRKEESSVRLKIQDMRSNLWYFGALHGATRF
jgi:hypothetical protein